MTEADWRTRSLEERTFRNREARALEGSFLVFTPRIFPGVESEGNVIKSPRSEMSWSLLDDCNKDDHWYHLMG